MALIKCPECGNDVSDSAPQCVKCGFPLKQSASQERSSASTAKSESRPDEMLEDFNRWTKNANPDEMLEDFKRWQSVPASQKRNSAASPGNKPVSRVDSEPDFEPTPSFGRKRSWTFIRWGLVAVLAIMALVFLGKNIDLSAGLVLVGVILGCWSKKRAGKIIRYGLVAVFAILAVHFFGKEEVTAAGSLAIGGIVFCWGRGNKFWKWAFVAFCAYISWRGYIGAFDPDEEKNKSIFWGAAVLGGLVGVWGMGFGTAFIKGCLSPRRRVVVYYDDD